MSKKNKKKPQKKAAPRANTSRANTSRANTAPRTAVASPAAASPAAAAPEAHAAATEAHAAAAPEARAAATEARTEASATQVEPEAHAAADTEADEGEAPATHESPTSALHHAEPVIPKPPRLDAVSLSDAVLDTEAQDDEDTLVPGYDLTEDTHGDIAPIGPTEFTGPPSADAPETDRSAHEQPSSASVEQLEQQIRDLEARLDAMIGQETDSARAPASEARPPSPTPKDEGMATAREVLSSDFYLRQWGRAGMRKRAEEVDDFGHDPAYESKFLPFLDFLYKHYFRVETDGADNIPETGRCLIVSNHSGGPLPYDGLMLRTTVRREHAMARELRWLAEDFIYYLPFVGAMMNRLGAVRACQENAERLLAQGRLVAVFPEGAKGIGKLYRERYRLQRFGRGGFIRLCLRTQTPLVPCAIVGAEEANPMLYRIEYMTKAFGIPYFPITPTFPALGPVGLLPAPTKWRISFGEVMSFDGYGPEAADDEILVGRLAERVRATIQAMLDRALAARRSVFFG